MTGLAVTVAVLMDVLMAVLMAASLFHFELTCKRCGHITHGNVYSLLKIAFMFYARPRWRDHPCIDERDKINDRA